MRMQETDFSDNFVRENDAEPVIEPGVYRHFKGNRYQVLCMARHSETREPMVVYRALYGEFGVWVRPASMWNETVERGGKTCKRFERVLTEQSDRSEQIARIERYEAVLNRATALLHTGDPALPALIDELEAYYTSALWKQDYADDEAGLLPASLRRGVLSEDGIDTLLEAYAGELS